MTIDETASIVALDQADEKIAREIKTLHNAAYTVEAQLLGLEKFPPLRRTLGSFTGAKSAFFGYMHQGSCVGLVELEIENISIVEVSSLVIHPKFHRRGIATKLMTYVLSEAQNRRVIVSTAAGNYPAIGLYEGLGFHIVDQWTTEGGIDIVQLAMGSQILD